MLPIRGHAAAAIATADDVIQPKSEPDAGLTEDERNGQRQQANACEQNPGIKRTLGGLLRLSGGGNERCSQAGHVEFQCVRYTTRIGVAANAEKVRCLRSVSHTCT